MKQQGDRKKERHTGRKVGQRERIKNLAKRKCQDCSCPMEGHCIGNHTDYGGNLGYKMQKTDKG